MSLLYEIQQVFNLHFIFKKIIKLTIFINLFYLDSFYFINLCIKYIINSLIYFNYLYKISYYDKFKNESLQSHFGLYFLIKNKIVKNELKVVMKCFNEIDSHKIYFNKF